MIHYSVDGNYLMNEVGDEQYNYTVGRVVALTPAQLKSANYNSVHKRGAALGDTIVSHTILNWYLHHRIKCKENLRTNYQFGPRSSHKSTK